MYRITTLTRDDGSVIKTTTEELQTEKNWNKKFFKLRRNAVGESMRWHTGYGSNKSVFYTDNEVLAMTEREREKYMEKQKQHRTEARERKKAEKEKQRKAEEAHFFKKFGVLAADGAVIALDTETTGLAESDEILQLSIIDGEGVVLFDSYFRPERHQEWPEAEAVNGISPSDVENKPTMASCRNLIQKIIDAADVIIAYNAAFDLDVLKRQGICIPTDAVVIDTMLLFAEIYGDYSEYHGNYRWQKLSLCADYYGYEWGNDTAHDALADCRATLFCTRQMRESLLPKLLALSEKHVVSGVSDIH